MSGKPTRLAGPIAGTGAAATLFTVGVGQVIVTDIQVCNTTGSAQTFKLSLGADAAGTRLFNAFSVPTGGVLNLTGLRWVLESREYLEWNGTTTLTIMVAGEVLA